MEPGYDWWTFQRDLKVSEKRRRAQWKLIRENQWIHCRLQKWGEQQCYMPVENWNDKEAWDFTGSTCQHVVTQVDGIVPEVVSRIVVMEDSPTQTTVIKSATVAVQTDGTSSHLSTAMQTVEKSSRIMRLTQTDVEQTLS